MDPQSPPVDLMSKADQELGVGDYASAIATLKTLTAGQPSNSMAWKKLTMALVAAQSFDEAITTGQTAAALIPQDADVRYAVAYAMVQKEQFEAAVEHLDAALNLNVHHQSARQLHHYAISQAGKSLVDTDPHKAESFLDRLHKMKPADHETIVALFDLYQKVGAKGKAVNLVKSLPEDVRQIAPVQEKIDNLSRDPDFANAIRMATITSSSAPQAAARPQQAQTVNYVPCPACRQPMPDFAAICPHCGARVRASGTFAGRNTGPDFIWQDVALNVVLVVMILLEGVEIWSQLRVSAAFGPMLGFGLVFDVLSVVVYLGSLFRSEFFIGILRWFLLVDIIFGLLGLLFAFTAMWWIGLLSLFSLALACFTLYLVNTVSD